MRKPRAIPIERELTLMEAQIKPSFENVGIITTIVTAIGAFIGWIYATVKRMLIRLIESRIAEHEKREAEVFKKIEIGMARFDERTQIMMVQLESISEAVGAERKDHKNGE